MHTICKLIHRNLNPGNILIATNDNWKLSGLDFAIRFESTAISESASMMANELQGPLQLRYTAGKSASQSALRRQRTLVSVPRKYQLALISMCQRARSSAII